MQLHSLRQLFSADRASGALRLFGFGEFGPDILPVIGAKVAAGYCAVGGSLDGNATLSSDRPTFGKPLIDESLAYAEKGGKRRLRHAPVREISCDIHGRNIAMLHWNSKSHAIP